MERARQLFTARYRAAFFEAVYVYTQLPVEEIDLTKFRKDHKEIVRQWESRNMSLEDKRKQIQDVLKKEKMNKAWVVPSRANNPNPKILIYGAPLANPYLVCDGENHFLVRK
jgi:malate synthase